MYPQTHPHQFASIKRPSDWRNAFTLSEMLVVLVIVALFFALLLPMVSKSRDRAASTHCVSNSRQLVIAWSLYSNDHNERLLPNVDGKMGGFTNWVAGNMTFDSDATDAHLLVDPTRSLISAYVRQSSIFKCPSDESAYVRSVSMNCRLNPTRDQNEGLPRWVGGTAFCTFRTLSDIKFSDRTFVVLDESSKSINDSYFAIDMSNTGTPDGLGAQRPYYLIDYPAAYHSKGATVSFADGHVALKKWFEPSAFKGPPPQFIAAPNKDIEWLQTHCTY